jgi:hypothetical protein
VKEDHPRVLSSHVLVDGNDINPVAAKRFENSLELGFKHDKIADDERVVRCRGPLDFRAKSVGGRPLFSRVI